MSQFSHPEASRLEAATRLLYSLLFLAAFELSKGLLFALCLAQFAIVLVTKRQSEHLRGFSNNLSHYLYRLARYLTLNDNEKPFPFSKLGVNPEAPVKLIRFD